MKLIKGITTTTETYIIGKFITNDSTTIKLMLGHTNVRDNLIIII